MTVLPAIDWPLAVKVAKRMVPAGPALARKDILRVVSGLRDSAARATDILADRSGLIIEAPASVLVVDRPGWIAANAEVAQDLLIRLDQSAERRRVVSEAMGVQAGVVLALFSTRVLGQYEGLSLQPRLLLIAPNMAAFERSTGVRPSSFRLWACLHESTHHFQFSHADWLASYLIGTVSRFLAAPDDSPEDEDFNAIIAVMSFLEGHAEVQMDIAAEGIIHDIPHLRRVLDHHRHTKGFLAFLQRLVGTDQKVAQYERGSAFCRYIYERGGIELLNLPLSAADYLPLPQEIDNPAHWVRRVG